MATLPFGETLPYDADGKGDDLDTSSSASSEEIFDITADDDADLDRNVVEDGRPAMFSDDELALRSFNIETQKRLIQL